jgi:hypothetical protein
MTRVLGMNVFGVAPPTFQPLRLLAWMEQRSLLKLQ